LISFLRLWVRVCYSLDVQMGALCSILALITEYLSKIEFRKGK